MAAAKAAALAAPKVQKDADHKIKYCLSVVEKKLDLSVYTFRHQNGSHYPLAVFTQNQGRRSEERHCERAYARALKRATNQLIKGSALAVENANRTEAEQRRNEPSASSWQK